MSIRSLIEKIRTPSTRYTAGTLVAVGVVLALIGLPTFDYVVHETSSDAFCLVCHSGDIGIEQAGRVHYDNAKGIRATCADCHLPREYFPKLVAKARAGANDVYHQVFLGTISTYDKFKAHRMHMATEVWADMKANDSRNCRYCHVEADWDLSLQSERARDFHESALSKGETCIDCHKGIAHELPEGIEEDHRPGSLDS